MKPISSSKQISELQRYVRVLQDFAIMIDASKEIPNLCLEAKERWHFFVMQ